MDTFTTLVGITTLAFIYMGERFRVGAYLLISAMLTILFAWRMGEEIFYVISAGIIFTTIYRAFNADDDVRESDIDKDRG